MARGLVSATRKIIRAKGDGAVCDADLIACAQRIEYYGIEGYGCAHTFAKARGEEAVGLLAQALKRRRIATSGLPDSLSRSSNYM